MKKIILGMILVAILVLGTSVVSFAGSQCENLRQPGKKDINVTVSNPAVWWGWPGKGFSFKVVAAKGLGNYYQDSGGIYVSSTTPYKIGMALSQKGCGCRGYGYGGGGNGGNTSWDNIGMVSPFESWKDLFDVAIGSNNDDNFRRADGYSLGISKNTLNLDSNSRLHNLYLRLVLSDGNKPRVTKLPNGKYKAVLTVTVTEKL